MTTRERIVEEALTLFSIQGYQGTSVKIIADKVGIKDSSLSKHFSSKKEIFDTIVQEMSVRMEAVSYTHLRSGKKKAKESSKQSGTEVM